MSHFYDALLYLASSLPRDLAKGTTIYIPDDEFHSLELRLLSMCQYGVDGPKEPGSFPKRILACGIEIKPKSEER